FKLGDDPSDELKAYQDENGRDSISLSAGLSWSHDSRDSALMPTEGGYQRVAGSVSIPGSDLEYYKFTYTNKYYIPLSNTFTLALEGDFGYGDSYGSTTKLPPWENFFAGGRKTVRGFKDFSLGPRDSQDEPLGGNLKLTGNIEVLFPAPFKLMEKSIRLGLFVDAGNVYDITDTSVELGEIRYSTGVSGFWLSPFGAFGISFGIPLNAESDDETEIFQFAFGSAF
ncbi:MAG: BamA/TamA family outer membrane protein, partial [Gammaproteobacteria bacterium]|nr:BamA/TamA family outer membrane protein [Gammaproteobacteria bacterium]